MEDILSKLIVLFMIGTFIFVTWIGYVVFHNVRVDRRGGHPLNRNYDFYRRANLDDHVGEVVNYHAKRKTRLLRLMMKMGSNKALAKNARIDMERDIDVKLTRAKFEGTRKPGMPDGKPRHIADGKISHGIGRHGIGTRRGTPREKRKSGGVPDLVRKLLLPSEKYKKRK